MRDKRIGNVLITCVLVVVLLPGWSVAQTSRSRLEGVVHDASGAVVPGATVTVLNTMGTTASNDQVIPHQFASFWFEPRDPVWPGRNRSGGGFAQ